MPHLYKNVITDLEVDYTNDVIRFIDYVRKEQPKLVIMFDQPNNSQNPLIRFHFKKFFIALHEKNISFFVSSSANVNFPWESIMDKYRIVHFDTFQLKSSLNLFNLFVSLQFYIFDQDIQNSISNDIFKSILFNLIIKYSSYISLRICEFISKCYGNSHWFIFETMNAK